MSAPRGQAIEVEDLVRVRMVGSAFKKTGAPVVLVPLGKGVHAGHLAMVQAAQRIRGGVLVVALNSTDEEDAAALRRAQVDYVWRYNDEELWPQGSRIAVHPSFAVLSDDGRLTQSLLRHLAIINALGPSDVIVGEKDYELLIALNQAVRDLHMNVRVQGVPTVRMPDGLALSLRNRQVDPTARDAAPALSAALTAGAHAAEYGADKVLSVVHEVAAAAGITLDYAEIRSRDLGPAPEVGDARLLAAATIGGVQLSDNVGLPLGIGFRNIES